MESRPDSRQHVNLAAIKSVFDHYPKMFVLHEALTIDEQLVAYQGNCPFRQYVPTKPKGKYGIKLWLFSDVKTTYVDNAEVYTGIPEYATLETNQRRNVVLRLVNKLEGSG